MTQSLEVFYESRTVGRIDVTHEGPSFTYDPTWLRTPGAFAISVMMPLTPRPVHPQIFLPWAENLLPEASALRAIGQKIGAAPEDALAILSEIGRDTAGALSIGKPGASGQGGWRPIPDANALERIINELPAKPFLVGEDGVSMSLAGVQSKIGVGISDDGKLCIPIDGAPSTHILKPDTERLPGSVQNEAFCMVLAHRCGLTVPTVTTGIANDRAYYLIQRYDRIAQRGRWRRLHQEDFCQALGRPPSAKYEANQTGVKGPSLTEMFALTRNVMTGADVLNLLDYVIFNILACNTDAHGKNYSLMISGKGVTLAPIYDVMCGSVWDGITKNLAQKIDGQNRGDHIKRRHWEAFANSAGLNPTRLMARIENLARVVLREIQPSMDEVQAMPAGGHYILPLIGNEIAARARRLVIGLGEGQEIVAATTTKALKRQRKAKSSATPEKPKAPSE